MYSSELFSLMLRMSNITCNFFSFLFFFFSFSFLFLLHIFSSFQLFIFVLSLFSWWGTFRHLSWSLLGLADLDKFDSADEISLNLTWTLYAIFMIVCVILLVNMMIALLSTTYQNVQVGHVWHSRPFKSLLDFIIVHMENITLWNETASF